jgi:hypothetical protein
VVFKHDHHNAAFEAKAAAARGLGIEAEAIDRAPLAFTTSGALRFAGQAQFHPVTYFQGLVVVLRDKVVRTLDACSSRCSSSYGWRLGSGEARHLPPRQRDAFSRRAHLVH